jgi:metal-responsive CopG/Arc/MetJ family transcriptional regulator
MRTVQVTLDEDLVMAVDRAAKRLGTTGSVFTRDAQRVALREVRARAMEKRQREGYAKAPVRKGEFDVWRSEQACGSRWGK